MSWRSLLQPACEVITAPWIGGRTIQTFNGRSWRIEGNLPAEHGWYVFDVSARKAVNPRKAMDPVTLNESQTGYLVGDRFVTDSVRPELDPSKLARNFERVHLIEEGLERFSRVRVGRFHQGGPLLYEGQEMPFGPEMEVLDTFLDEGESVDHVANVPPALDAAFRFETWRRKEAQKRREEEDKRRQEKAERLAKEQRRQEMAERLGDGAGRREMAPVDFAAAARAALAIGGATYLDHRVIYRDHEMAVTFRMDGSRYQCTCDVNTLRVIDAGVCLTDECSGERGDSYFTLESLPGVIRQAIKENVLVVFRHV